MAVFLSASSSHSSCHCQLAEPRAEGCLELWDVALWQTHRAHLASHPKAGGLPACFLSRVGSLRDKGGCHCLLCWAVPWATPVWPLGQRGPGLVQGCAEECRLDWCGTGLGVPSVSQGSSWGTPTLGQRGFLLP